MTRRHSDCEPTPTEGRRHGPPPSHTCVRRAPARSVRHRCNPGRCPREQHGQRPGRRAGVRATGADRGSDDLFGPALGRHRGLSHSRRAAEIGRAQPALVSGQPRRHRAGPDPGRDARERRRGGGKGDRGGRHHRVPQCRRHRQHARPGSAERGRRQDAGRLRRHRYDPPPALLFPPRRRDLQLRRGAVLLRPVLRSVPRLPRADRGPGRQP